MTPKLNFRRTPIDNRALYINTRQKYEAARGVVHGLSKDSPQNSFGHRIKNNAENWGLSYELKTINGQTLVIITDKGTSGLIGEVPNDDNHMYALRTNYNEKLARYMSLLSDGTNISGAAGSKGIGNLTFQFNSKKDEIIWDSKTIHGDYYASKRLFDNDEGIVDASLYQGEEAKDLINELTGLNPLENPGLRTIIVDPTEDLIEALKSGLFEKYIADTWFEMLGKYESTMDGIQIIIDGKKKEVELPRHWKKYFNNEYTYNEIFVLDPIETTFSYTDPSSNTNYRNVRAKAKIVYILADKVLDEDQRGLVINRENMSINQLNNSRIFDPDLPHDYKNRVFGYVSLDKTKIRKTGKREIRKNSIRK